MIYLDGFYRRLLFSSLSIDMLKGKVIFLWINKQPELQKKKLFLKEWISLSKDLRIRSSNVNIQQVAWWRNLFLSESFLSSIFRIRIFLSVKGKQWQAHSSFLLNFEYIFFHSCILRREHWATEVSFQLKYSHISLEQTKLMQTKVNMHKMKSSLILYSFLFIFQLSLSHMFHQTMELAEHSDFHY